MSQNQAFQESQSRQICRGTSVVEQHHQWISADTHCLLIQLLTGDIIPMAYHPCGCSFWIFFLKADSIPVGGFYLWVDFYKGTSGNSHLKFMIKKSGLPIYFVHATDFYTGTIYGGCHHNAIRIGTCLMISPASDKGWRALKFQGWWSQCTTTDSYEFQNQVNNFHKYPTGS